MPFERANIIQLRPNVHLIDDAGESTCYLITGRERALLVDTANGYENLSEIVRSLTDLPVIVVNTHGHGDHIFGNVYFEDAWLHPADFGLHDMFFGYAKEDMEKQGLKPAALHALELGQIFDLGGVQLDLMGQENAESGGKRQLSGTGGQLDFLEGAFRSAGGKGFICLNSARTAKDGSLVSNIVPCIPGGSTVSAPRGVVQYVATEYGVARLSGLDLRQRAQEMIRIAHPDFRRELEAYAKETFG